MRRLLAVLPLLALASGCEDVPPPPGEVIGTFSFEGALESGDPAACDFPESPASLRFDAVLSYEPEPLDDGTRKFWLQLLGQGGEVREGRLTGTRFFVRSPPDPERVPRSLEACRFDDNRDGVPDRTRCTLGVAELVGGELLSRVPSGLPPAVACDAATLDECDRAGGERACRLAAFEGDATPVGAVCSDVTEEVVPEAADTPCLCTGSDGVVAPARTCTIVYRMIGRP